MALKIDEIKEVLQEELENKKMYEASWDTDCNVCGDTILEGDEFCYMGNKRKVCENCRSEIIDFVTL